MSSPLSFLQRPIQVLLAILAIGVWGLLLRPYLPSAVAATQESAAARSATYDTLNVQRINVVDPDGKMRLIIANGARFPGAIVHGKTYPRSIDNAAGVLFLDSKGEETGGLALAKLRDTDVANLTFDYTYQLTDGIKMWKQESADGAPASRSSIVAPIAARWNRARASSASRWPMRIRMRSWSFPTHRVVPASASVWTRRGSRAS
jgi:hypothetical protein